jgi:uncharacterized protein (DUF58 family)
VKRLRQAAISRLTRWSARRHGRDTLPFTIDRRRIYIIPTRFGLALALLLAAMLIAGLNYNSNLGLAFGFLTASLALVAMHHCHRNLLGLSVDAATEVDAFAGGAATFDFVLRNDSGIERRDIELLCWEGTAGARSVPAGGYRATAVQSPVPQRGTTHLERFELRTRHPFGWFRAWTYVHCPLTVFAAPLPRGGRPPPQFAGMDAAASAADARGDDDYAGLRAYQAGVPLKHMAWKVLARGGEAAVRTYSGSAAQPKWLEWSALEALSAEERLSQLCRWVLDAERAQRVYGLRLPGTEILPGRGPAHRSACLRALAGYPVESSH